MPDAATMPPSAALHAGGHDLIIGATLGRYFSIRFLKTILVVFGTVFALVYTIDFVELMRRAGLTAGADAMSPR